MAGGSDRESPWAGARRGRTGRGRAAQGAGGPGRRRALPGLPVASLSGGRCRTGAGRDRRRRGGSANPCRVSADVAVECIWRLLLLCCSVDCGSAINLSQLGRG